METELVDQCNICRGVAFEVVDADCNITRCRTCGYIFDNPRPTFQELTAFYARPTQYDSWLAELHPRERLWKRRLNKLSRTKKPGNMLDVGAGIGQFLELARRSYTGVYGTEVSSTAIQIAKKKYQLDLFPGTLENLEMRSETYDNIAVFHVLEHVPDPRLLLRTCHRLLSAQGILVIAVPNEVASLRAFARRILQKAGLKKHRRLGTFGLPRISLEQNSPEVHLSHFTPRVLERALQMEGFSVVENTLDPYYVAMGIARAKADIYYCLCSALLSIFRINLYDAILMIARKTTSTSGPSLPTKYT
jgi:ubiquinone/menaquinone biosynthesis C-methylase UbiE